MTAIGARSEALQRFVDYWHGLTPDAVAALDGVYTSDAYFRDPFNEVTGIAAIKHIFNDMFVRLEQPRFTIVETIEQEHGVLLVWDFDFRIKTFKPEVARRIHGTSHIRFAADGRVQYHRDYWDAAGELYEQLPLIGSLLRFLKKRMA
ncbi:MAG: nuclear transport factor 2 family protein [Betaproteobacteria bacterium]